MNAKVSASFFSFLTLCSLSYAGQVVEIQPSTPYIEYNNRMVCFYPTHQAYERIKPNDLYVGLEGWVLAGKKAAAEAELRMGHNYFWNGRDHFTPVAGVGIFKTLHKHAHFAGEQWIFGLPTPHHTRPALVYGMVGFLYEHEFASVFSWGINVKLMAGAQAGHHSHHNWGSIIGGVDGAMPFTFRFGKERHWDIRLEPFYIYFQGKNALEQFTGIRTGIGYRF